VPYFIVEGSGVPGPGPRTIWANAFVTREEAGVAALRLVPEGPYVIMEAPDLVASYDHLQQAPRASDEATQATPPEGVGTHPAPIDRP
jgi:hypothetical protein